MLCTNLLETLGLFRMEWNRRLARTTRVQNVHLSIVASMVATTHSIVFGLIASHASGTLVCGRMD